MDDVVSAGSDRPPVRAPWLVAGAVALAALAVAGTLRAREPDRAAAPPTVSPSAAPRATIPPEADPVFGPNGRRGLPAVPPTRGLTLRLASANGVREVDTSDGATRRLLDLRPGEMLVEYLPVRGGFAAVLGPEYDVADVATTLVVVRGDEVRRTPLRGTVRLLPAATDETFLTLTAADLRLRRYDASGDPVGEPFAPPPDAVVLRETAAGLLLQDDDAELRRLRLWDPVRRTERPFAAGSWHVGGTGRFLVTATFCGHSGCPLDVHDLAQGRSWRVPMPDRRGGVVYSAVDARGTLAFAWGYETTDRVRVYVAPRGGEASQVAALPANGPLAWAEPGRLVMSEIHPGHTVVKVWDRWDGLRWAGSYPGGDTTDVEARPAAAAVTRRR
jgi:hypothetical protein